MTRAPHAAAEIRARLDHPVIDADGHFVEIGPLLQDELVAFVEREGGAALRERYVAGAARPTDTSTNLRAHALRGAADRWESMPSWWGWPTERVLDRATAHLPALLHERLPELGIDFAVLYPSMTLAFLDLLDEELAPLLCRAANRMHARLFAPYADRLAVGALIPMNTPAIALEVLEDALALGFKAGVISTFVRREIPAVAQRLAPGAPPVTRWDTYGLDSAHDYDPFWARCVGARFVPVSHGSTQQHHVARSVSSYVYNHVGGVARGQEALCKSLFLGGVTHRFPKLRVGFLEGGVAWACSLYADLLGHWEKRNGRAIHGLDPDRLDVPALLQHFERRGGPEVRAARERLQAYFAAPAARPAQLDEFAAAGLEKQTDLRDRFVPNFYFGCEADDPLAAWAFAERINPLGARLRAMFGSDIAHWDVVDMCDPLPEAHELLERGALTPRDFRDFVFGNAVRLHAGTHPDFFLGTSVEAAVHAELAEELA